MTGVQASRPQGSEIRLEFVEMARLAGPLVLAEFGWMAMSIVDTMFVGRLGAVAIGAVGLAAMLYYGIAICSSGLLLGLDTLVSRAWGSGNRDDARHSLVSGIWISAMLIPFVMGLAWACEPLLAFLGIDPAVRSAAIPYLRALNWSTPPLLIYFALRRYVQAVDAERLVMLALLSANLVNALGCWMLVFGHLGAPRMGTEGAGWATCISRTYMAAFLIAVVLRKSRGLASGGWNWQPDWKRITALLRLGLPACGQMTMEIGVFAVVTVLIGKLNPLTLAGHQIALTTVSTTYMMPLGISSAAAVRVGQALGRGDRHGAVRSGWAALALGALLMSAAALTLLTMPQWIARLFTPESAVIQAASQLLRIAAFFQLFDGLQSVATGALRGAGDTRTPMICHFAGYWVIGLPVGAYLCFAENLGAAGLWTGLSTGLILIGIVLASVWRNKAKKLEPVIRY